MFWLGLAEATGTLILAVGTLALAAVAIFPEHARALVYRPIAYVFYGRHSFLFQQMSSQGGTPQFVLRLLVTNVGNSLATVIECHVTDLRFINVSGHQQRMPNFIPIRLRWTHTSEPVVDYLAEATSRVVDLAYLALEAATNLPVLSLATEIGFHQFTTLPAGSYVVELTVTSKERTLFKGCLHVSFTNQWHGSGVPAQLTLSAGDLYVGRLLER